VERNEKGRVNTVKVIQEILAWSADRPTWQRDALRRLVMNGELSGDDIRPLTEICKGEHGLVEKAEIKPLAKEHVPDRDGTVAAVSLDSIFHHKGAVDALLRLWHIRKPANQYHNQSNRCDCRNKQPA
jgi:hypothetical protein